MVSTVQTADDEKTAPPAEAKRVLVKPPKPFPTFPLFPHNNGNWTKKIRGAHVRFGVWRWPDQVEYDRTWREALEAYHRFTEALAMNARTAADPRLMTFGAIANAYLAAKHAQAVAGERKPRTFAEQRAILREMKAALLHPTRKDEDGDRDTYTVGELERDPKTLRVFIANLRARFGFHAFNRNTRYIRSMWTWAADPQEGVLGGRGFAWLNLHRQLEIKTFRRQRRLEQAAGIFRTFEPDELRAIIAASSPTMRALVLLAYFAAYGNTDLGELPRNVMKVYEQDQPIHLAGKADVVPAGWALLTYPRPKTELDRYAIVPPVVVEAVQQAMARTRGIRPARKDLVDRAFLTAKGRSVCYSITHHDEAGLIDRVTNVDNIAQPFDRVVKRLGRCVEHGWVVRKGFVRSGRKVCPECGAELSPMPPRSFYCLRHTATTFAAGSGASSDTRNLFEGHAADGKSVRQTFYLDPRQMHDLVLIGRELSARLALPAGPRMSNGPDGD